MIAADSSVWVGDTLLCSMKKLYRLKDGSIAGFCGSISDALKLIKHINDGTESKEKVNDDVEVLLVTPSKRIMTYAGNTSTILKPTKTEYIAIGSGTAFALGAMHNGGTAVDAIKAAIAHDSKSRGPVVSMSIEVK